MDNPHIESFNDSFRSGCQSMNWFMLLEDARDKIERRRRGYNEFRLHSALTTWHRLNSPKNRALPPSEHRFFLIKPGLFFGGHLTESNISRRIAHKEKPWNFRSHLMSWNYKSPRNWTEPRWLDTNKSPYRRNTKNYMNWRRFSSGVSFVLSWIRSWL